MAAAKVILIVVLAFAVAGVPSAIGAFFGFGAVVVTPVVMVVLLVGFGVLIGLLMPGCRWLWSAVGSIVIAAAFTVQVRVALVRDPQRVSLQTFVVVPIGEGPAFTGKLAAILRERGIDPSLSHWSYANDDPHYGLGATKGSVKIVAYNVDMSGFAAGHPDGRCIDAGSEPRPDPGQYILSMSTWVPCAEHAETRQLFADVKRDLGDRGFELLDQRVPCSAIAHVPKR